MRERVPSEVLKGGYSNEEVANIYELGRWSLENGDLSRGAAIMHGLNSVAPQFAPAWLGSAYVAMMQRNNEDALQAVKGAMATEPESPEVLIYLVVALLNIGDMNSAGTYLGEVGERVDGGAIDDPRIIRLYRAQLARYQTRR